MISTAFELGEEIKLKTVDFPLNQKLWERFDLPIDLNFSHWKTIKYLNDDGTEFSDDIDLLPNNCGGVYLFSVRCPVIPGITEFPFYIGRAQHTNNQNLRKRCREYFLRYKKGVERPKITKMFNYWKNELYLSFYELNENNDTIDLEKKLINSLLLPMNEEIPDKEEKQAVRAF
ncbi:hypothetical protein [Marinilabilia sp.]|jgi:hypothetical protein|uniref:hypothetical protein n=1 Tax=Marinilabilia sp. TaxID=2021252 RepID=UPI0025BAE371|nr:hypothetical protein [Marinilabilia sp.]